MSYSSIISLDACRCYSTNLLLSALVICHCFCIFLLLSGTTLRATEPQNFELLLLLLLLPSFQRY